MKVISPIAAGNGASVIHQSLDRNIRGYQAISYNPYLTLFPPSLYLIGRSVSTDLIHTTADYAMFHYRESVPMVLTFHGFVLDKYMRGFSSTLQSLHYQTNLKYQTKKALPLAKIITAVSNYTADLVSAELSPDTEIRTIYNGIDETVFTPLADERKNHSKQVKVLIAGHYSVKKGSHWVRGVLENLNDHIMVYYTTGLGSSREYLPHQKLTSLGSVPHSEMCSVYQSCDILLFPTVREGFGLVAAEAMSCGLPVVATNCSSLPELITEGKGGYLCELGNVKEFAEKINRLADNPLLRREMGEYNRSRIEETFTIQKMIGNYQSVFEEALS